MAFEDGIPNTFSSNGLDITFPDEGFNVNSEPNSRTSSVKYKKPRNKHLSVPEEDKRRNSLPLSAELVISGSLEGPKERTRQKVRKVRSFRMTSKGVQNDKEDEIRQSNLSIHSSLSQKEYFRQRLSSNTSDDSAICCGCSVSSINGYYRVCVMGAGDVGKTALTTQFMSSDFKSSFDFDSDEIDEQTLTVVIDNEESILEFVDFSKHRNVLESNTIDIFVVVFSVHERPTFNEAVNYVEYLSSEVFTDRPIVLVANKIDLVRKRQVTSEEAVEFAKKYNCKYTETSAALNVQVDELLVGIVRQIKFKLNPDLNESISISTKPNEKIQKGAKGLFKRLFKRKAKLLTDILHD